MYKADKILSIQYLRGVAALAVVFCHFGFLLSGHPHLASAFSYGQFGVLIFFFVSGFIIVYSLEKEGYKPNQFFIFLAKRSIRIDPPYWVTIGVYILLGYFSGVGQLIAQLTYTIPFTDFHFYTHVFWTLCIEFQFYVLIGLFYFLFDSKLYKTIFLLVFGAITLLPINGDALIFNHCAVFAFGISFMIFYKDKIWHNAILPIFLLCLIAFGVRILEALLLIAAAITILLPDKKIKPLAFLGDISYSLYLTHSFVGDIANGILKRFAIGQYPLLCLGIELIAAILFAWLFYRLIERPSIRLSKKFIYQRTSRLSVKGSLMQTR